MSYMSEIKSKLDVNQEVHICGDFNCNMLKRTGLSSSIHDICNLIGATQLVTEPTRVTQSSAYCILRKMRKMRKLRIGCSMRNICARFSPNAQHMRKICARFYFFPRCAIYAQDCTYFSNAQYMCKICARLYLFPQRARFAQDCTSFSNAQ